MIFPTGIFLLSNIFSNSSAVCAAFFFRISAECNPAEQPYKRDAEENADAVDADVLYRRARLATIVWWNSSLAAKATQRMPARNVSAKPRRP